MRLRNSLHIVAALVLGFTAGSLFGHGKIVKAQSELKVYTKQLSSVTDFANVVPGSQIVGFSCVSEKNAVFTDCYVAYLK